MRTEFAPSCPVSIFIAGNYDFATAICSSFCDDVGFCVTVAPTRYVYTGGCEEGVVVGLINYPRFPAELADIEVKAIELGMRLREGLRQESFSVQTPAMTTWFSWREANLASADTRPEGGDSTEIEAPFTGGAVGSEASETPNPQHVDEADARNVSRNLSPSNSRKV